MEEIVLFCEDTQQLSIQDGSHLQPAINLSTDGHRHQPPIYIYNFVSPECHFQMQTASEDELTSTTTRHLQPHHRYRRPRYRGWGWSIFRKTKSLYKTTKL